MLRPLVIAAWLAGGLLLVAAAVLSPLTSWQVLSGMMQTAPAKVLQCFALAAGAAASLWMGSSAIAARFRHPWVRR